MTRLGALLLVTALLGFCGDAEAAGKLFTLAEDLQVTGSANLPALNLSAFSEFAVIATTNALNGASVQFRFADAPGPITAPGEPRSQWTACALSETGVSQCFISTGAVLPTMRVQGPILLSDFGCGSCTVTIKIWAIR